MLTSKYITLQNSSHKHKVVFMCCFLVIINICFFLKSEGVRKNILKKCFKKHTLCNNLTEGKGEKY